MPLSTAQIIELAPAGNFGMVDRYLPEPYRRSLSHDGDPMASMTRVTRDTLRRALSELDAVQRSRALEFFNDLTDGRLLGALHDQTPWPEDTIDTFRIRLTQVSALAMRGAATADRLLSLAAVAMNASALQSGTGARSIPPLTDYAITQRQKKLDGTTDQLRITGKTTDGQTRRFFAKPGDGALVPADVFDAPLRRYDAEIEPLAGPDFRFVLDNPASENLAGLDGATPLKWPDPIFTLATGDQPFGPFALVQTGQAQVIVVNRVIPPQTWLQFSPRDMGWTHDTTAANKTKIGPFTHADGKQALYAGLSLSASDHQVPSALTDPIGPLLSLRTKDTLTFTGEQSPLPPNWSPQPPDQVIDLPSFLGEGRSHWRMVLIETPTDGSTDIHDAQFAPVPSDADITLSARWFGRRPGEFALVVPPTALDPAMAGPLPHRQAWLDNMVERFKLAGTVRISQDLLFTDADAFSGLTEIALVDKVTATDTLDLLDPLLLDDQVWPTDAIELLQDQAIAVSDSVQPVDTIELMSTEEEFPPFLSAAHPSDDISFAEGLPPEFTDTAHPLDSIELLPGLSFDLGSSAHPVDGWDIAEGFPPDFVETATPGDHIDLTPEVVLHFDDAAKPGDQITVTPIRIILDPTRPLEPLEPVFPTGPVIVTPTRLRSQTLEFSETVKPTDRITIRRLRR